jgi:hypothetical protein
MGNILINVPDISDTDLVFDEGETRRILKFFWPHQANKIDGMTIDNDVRRLAQTGLVAAIDGSYALGFIFALGQTVVRPGSGVKSFAKKLARQFVRHWWKHTKQRDLEDVQIYDVVKDRIAGALRPRLDLILQGVALKRGGLLFYATANRPLFAWA